MQMRRSLRQGSIQVSGEVAMRGRPRDERQGEREANLKEQSGAETTAGLGEPRSEPKCVFDLTVFCLWSPGLGIRKAHE